MFGRASVYIGREGGFAKFERVRKASDMSVPAKWIPASIARDIHLQRSYPSYSSCCSALQLLVRSCRSRQSFLQRQVSALSAAGRAEDISRTLLYSITRRVHCLIALLRHRCSLQSNAVKGGFTRYFLNDCTLEYKRKNPSPASECFLLLV